MVKYELMNRLIFQFNKKVILLLGKEDFKTFQIKEKLIFMILNKKH